MFKFADGYVFLYSVRQPGLLIPISLLQVRGPEKTKNYWYMYL